LRDILGEPGLLHRVLAVGRQAFDGGDGLAGDVADLDAAGAHGFAVHMHGAGAALRDAAAEFGAGQSDLIANDPEQRRLRLDVELMRVAVDGDGDHEMSLPR
jgi:hypothetical protein